MIDDAALGSLPIFSELTPRELQVLRGIVRMRALKPGEVLCREGDPGTSFFVVARGQVGVYRKLGGPAPERVVTLGPGAMVGEISLIDGGRRSAECRAESAAVLVELARDDFDRLFHAATPFAFKILRHVARDLVGRFRGTVKRLREAHEQVRAADRSRATAALAARYASELLMGAEYDDAELESITVVDPAGR